MVRVAALLATALAGLAAAKSAVLDLTPANFDDVVLKSGKPTLVEFFAPWCGHCKTLAPIYEELAEAFAFSDKVQIAKVDADAERSLGQRFGVKGFPTLKFFDGQSADPVDYQQARTLESLSAFITEKTSVRPRKSKAAADATSHVAMLTDDTFSAAVGGDRDVLVAFTAPWCGHCKNLAPTYEKVAADFAAEKDTVLVAKVDADAPTGKQTAARYEVASYPTIKFFPRGSTTPEDYQGGRSEADFVAFLNSKAGTHRTPGGGLDAQAGTIAALDAVVARFAGGAAALADAAAEAKKAVNALQTDTRAAFAAYYLRVFDKLAQNEAFVTKELARLEGILSRGGLVPAKADELTSKTNILRRFATPPAEKEMARDEL